MPAKLIPIELILVEGSTFQSNQLRIRLLKENIMRPICSSCNLKTWIGQPIPLELDHINGVNDDNRLVNLRLLCPNCHALTNNYRGKNWGNASKRHYYAK